MPGVSRSVGKIWNFSIARSNQCENAAVPGLFCRKKYTAHTFLNEILLFMKDRRLRLILDTYAMAHSFDMSDRLGKFF